MKNKTSDRFTRHVRAHLDGGSLTITQLQDALRRPRRAGTGWWAITASPSKFATELQELGFQVRRRNRRVYVSA